MAGAWLAAASCGGGAEPVSLSETGGSPAKTGATTTGAPGGQKSGTDSLGRACSAPVPDARKHPGCFDYESCAHCHQEWWGGWVYTNSVGDDWVSEATVTITNSDGSTVGAPTAVDGFFHLEGTITSSFTPCVSKCPNTSCATKTHNSIDCQTSECHGGANRLIYLAGATGSTQPAGDSSSGGQGCLGPALGGPRVHSAADSDGLGCSICHDPGVYTGGFLYDGITSTTAMARATLTLTPSGGSPITAVTGLGGMFYFPGYVSVPYTVCVSRCPNTLCSASGTHTTQDDCRTCHHESLRIYLP